ncbi:hypothetical protein DMB66_18805 [Actinoplanes sp. ATCC 53533]|uniref:hypothetical protein n=1 Tax=Actinoplanes sp. ATCC 53533 TaxID=1288362 RepID=UPI000F78F3CE|nr:hypothetical protein [Actinoplanes sp. ATCC 53533]RSM64698.1 hypothetical protein DMB66_18805 [Actinoplanes sp. ATCC 53533]
MTFLQRLIERWWSLWAIAGGLGLTRVTPLPPPQVDPRISAAELTAEAERQGVADSRTRMYDSWSFGGPDDPPSEDFDPDYVRELRSRRDAALASLRAAQQHTQERIAAAQARRDESQARMDDARARMAGLATQDAAAEARNAADLDGLLDPVEQPQDGDRTPWEGETVPLRLIWRVLILGVLIAAEAIVQFAVFDYFLGDVPQQGALIRWMTLLTSAVIVLGPFLSGALLRSRNATGGERHGWYAVAVLVASWLFVVVVLGLLRGRVLEERLERPEQVTVTPLTVILMFVALMLMVGAMSFMLGLARRHPFQEAYVRNRAHRNRFDLLMRAMATRLNPAYLSPPGPDGPAGGDPEIQERAIRDAYAAAEDAYFAALARTVGDPSFTEAVQHRRGLQVRR